MPLIESVPASDVRALLVSEVFPPAIGGSGELMANVYRRLPGASVTVFTVSVAGSFPTDPPGLRVIREEIRATRWGLLHPAGAWHHLKRAARQARLVARRPTVTHCCCLLPEGLDARLAQMLGAGPYVCWAHGEELAIISGSRELIWLARRVASGAAAIIANSSNTASWARQLGVPSDRLHAVTPGVDVDRFRPDRPDAATLRAILARPDELVLLTVGRLQKRKGHDLVLLALGALDDLPAWRYVIVGDGEERSALERLARELKLGDRVRFAGAVPSDVLPDYYAAADLFVHPNRALPNDFEGFGLVFLEAAAAGLATIGGASGGVPEAVADGVTGILISGSDSAELARVMRTLMIDRDRRRALGQAGRARVLHDFSWERVAERVMAIHRDVAHQAFGGIR